MDIEMAISFRTEEKRIIIHILNFLNLFCNLHTHPQPHSDVNLMYLNIVKQ